MGGDVGANTAGLCPQSPSGAAIRSPRSLRRLPGRASAEPAAAHVAPGLRIPPAGAGRGWGRGGGSAGPEGRALGGGRGGPRPPRLPPRPGGPRSRPGRPPRLPLHPGEGVPEAAPTLSPPPAPPAPAPAGGAPLCQTVSTLCKDKEQSEEEGEDGVQGEEEGAMRASQRAALGTPARL